MVTKDPGKPWEASIDHNDLMYYITRDGSPVIGVVGEGATARGAVNDLSKTIRGATIHTGQHLAAREFQVPPNLEIVRMM